MKTQKKTQKKISLEKYLEFIWRSQIDKKNSNESENQKLEKRKIENWNIRNK